MKVYDRNLTGTAPPEPSQTQEAERSGRSGGTDQTGGAVGGGDRVELSSTLGSLSRALSSYSSDRAGRVQQLAAQYLSGSYQPDTAAISRGIVQEALGA
jgi:anti-sigma28 factor (negative regulator of flagellin synthesis)